MLDKVYAIWVNRDHNGKGQIYQDKTYIIKTEALYEAKKLNEEDFDNEYTVEPLSVR